MTDPTDDLVGELTPDSVPDDPDEGQAADTLAEWHAQSLDEASWAARKLARRREQKAELEAVAERERAVIDAWEAKVTARLTADCAFFEGRLEAFHRQVLEDDPKRLTVDLAHARLSSRKGSLSVQVDDLDAFVAWCEEQGRADLLAYKDPEPAKKEIVAGTASKVGDEPGSYDAFSQDTGEAIPGIHFERKPRTFTVTPDVPTKKKKVADDVGDPGE